MKIKTNQEGMTLVEVVVSMAIFSFTFLGVTMCLAASLKLNNRNMLRDAELNTQQKVIEERQAVGVALQSGHALEGDTMVFGTSGSFNMDTGRGVVDKITQYHAIKTGSHGNDYNFEINGIASNKNPLGNAAGDFDKVAGKFCLKVINSYSGSCDVTVSISNGTIYEGNYNTGYRNAAPKYSRTIPGKDAETTVLGAMPNVLQIGYFNDVGFAADELQITVQTDKFTRTYSPDYSKMKLFGGFKIEIGATGHVSASHSL